MKVEEVIRLGKVASERVDVSIFDFSLWTWIILIVIAIASFMALSSGFEFIVVVFPIWAFIALMVFAVNEYKEQAIIDEKVSKWKEKIAKPYIESLPVDKREVVFIKIDPELSHDVSGSIFFGSGYTRSEEVQRTPLTVSFKENGITTLTDWYETRMELTEDEKPHVKFQKLDRDLGNGIGKGFYNVEINLPDSYEFTDIK